MQKLIQSLAASPAVALVLLTTLMLFTGSPQASTRVVMAESQARVLLNKRVASELDISNYLEVLHDPTAKRSLQQIQAENTPFERIEHGGIQTHLGRNVYWVRGNISSSLTDPSQSGDWLLLLQNSQVLDAQLFAADTLEPLSFPVGLSHVSSGRDLSGRYPVIPLQLSNHASLSFYLRIQTDGVSSIPVKVWNRDAYLFTSRSLLPVWGLVFGALGGLALYNLFIYLSLRQTAYLQLSGFLCCMLWLTAVEEGFASDYFLGDAPWLNIPMKYCAQFFALTTAILFTRDFLNTSRRYPLVETVLQLTQWSSLLLVIGNITFGWGSMLMQPAFVGLVALFAGGSIMASMHGSDRGTRFYIAGWSLFFVGFLVYQFVQFGLLPANDFTLHGKDVTSCFLGVSLSLGMAAQIQRERFERKRALLRQQETMLELKYSEDQIQKKVLRDTLQEFPGLNALKSALDEAISVAPGSNVPVVLVLMDLHHVDRVGEQMGHAARNELLTRATKRLSVILRSVSGVMPLNTSSYGYIPMAVLSDGSYGFILRGMTNDTINNAIEEVDLSMMRPFFYQGVALKPGISFGLSRLGEQGEDVESLWFHAQLSLHADRNKNLTKPYELDSVDQYNARNIALINELRSAIHEDQITLYFQPIYDLARHYVGGLEVFSRWESLGGEKVSPTEIFYLAEVGGFVAELTLKVVEKALRFFVLAIDAQQSMLKLSINLSPKCLREDHFMDEVGLLLAKYRLPAQRLSFEIKEAAIIEDPSITREVLNRIRNMGIGLTIDEFGTAYSNPSYLTSLPVTEVKLDQQFVVRLDEPDVHAMVQTLIILCREQNIKLVVHGVEDETTLLRLEQMGCSFAQGHYLAAPILARDFKLPRSRFSPVQLQRA